MLLDSLGGDIWEKMFGKPAEPLSCRRAEEWSVDQSELYAKQQFKPAWFSLVDIQAHAEKTYRLGE